MEEQVLQKVLQSVNENRPVALVTLTEVNGSTPRDSGSIMAVFKDGSSIGSIGGGKVEFTVTNEAIEALAEGKDRTFSHSLTPSGDLKMECGGNAKGYIKIFGIKNRLIIAGGGHVGQKVLELGKFLGFYCVVVDDRSDYKDKESLKIADEVIIDSYEKAIEKLQVDANTYIVVATKSHLDDVMFAKTVMRSSCKYLGVIGSLRKHKSIKKTLISDGFSENDISKIYGPIGLNISNQLPEEIAVSILSEILLIKNDGKLQHMKNL